VKSIKTDILIVGRQNIMAGENRRMWWRMIQAFELAINFPGPDSDTMDITNDKG
jgi:hypothetical protein